MYKPARRMAVAATTMTGKLRGVDHVAAAARRHVGNLMFLGNSPRPRDRGAAEQGHELAPFQLIELHSIPASQGRASQGRISGYRIGKDQSGGIGTILQPVFSPMSALGQKEKSLRRTYVVQITRKGDTAARFMSTRPRT